MKKKLTFLFAVLLSMVSIKSFAHDIEVANSDGKTIYYIFTNNKSELAVSYRGNNYSYININEYSGDVAIPESVTYRGITYSVTSIGERAFSDCSGLTSVTIPNSVTSIGDYAFNLCSSLTSITIPNSVTSIGDYAFNLCTSLTSITIPNSVTSIGGWAFLNCSSLTSITIPNSVTSIGAWAFENCTSLSSITIPNSVTSIGDYTFYGCRSLTSIVVERGNAVYDSRNNCNAIIETSTNTLIAGCKYTIIPNSVTSIGDHAFSGCSSLTSITIPNSVTSIGWEAFYGCSSLTSITIPNSVTSIGGSVFWGCSSLTSITIPNSVTSIGDFAFYGCSGLTSITIPNGVTSIGNSAFSGCSSLTSITIPNSVTSIGRYAFCGCSLNTVIIGSGIKDIKEEAFGDCQNIENVYCYAVRHPSTHKTAFENSYPDYITLHVPSNGVEQYAAIEPWSYFHAIVAIKSGDPSVDDGGGEGSNSDKCATPTIDYSGKELTFNCETDGVEFVYEITDADVKKGNANILSLTATYEISVYATKAGYENSDKATATLVWGSATFTDTTPATAIEMVPAMEAAMPVLIQNNGGMLTVQGAQDGTPVSVYTIAGTEAGSAVSQNSRATISTSMQQGDIAIIKIGERSIKVVLK